MQAAGARVERRAPWRRPPGATAAEGSPVGGGHGVMVSWAVPGGQAVDGAVDSSEKVGDGDPVVGGQPVDVRQ
ncbi:hypothetical protein GCM10020227_64390 [Streptomyces flavovirens]